MDGEYMTVPVGGRMEPCAKAEGLDAPSGFEVTDLYTARGTHEGCGECCSRFLPLSRSEEAILRNRAKRDGIRGEAAGLDMMCPFLDLESRLCGCYDVRPVICRVYDCSEHRRLGKVAPAMHMAALGNEPRALRDMWEVVAP